MREYICGARTERIASMPDCVDRAESAISPDSLSIPPRFPSDSPPIPSVLGGSRGAVRRFRESKEKEKRGERIHRFLQNR